MTPASSSTSDRPRTGRTRPTRRRRPRRRAAPWNRARLRDRLATGVDPAHLARAEPDEHRRRGRGRSRSRRRRGTRRQARSRSRGLRGPWAAAWSRGPGRRDRPRGRPAHLTSTAPPARPDRAELVDAGPARGPSLERRVQRRRAGWASQPRTSSASSSKPGATTTSRKIDVSARATSRGRPVPVNATTPPNAATGSPASAASQASRSVARSAAPHGLVCLTMTHGRPAQERGRAPAAADASRTLL